MLVLGRIAVDVTYLLLPGKIQPSFVRPLDS